MKANKAVAAIPGATSLSTEELAVELKCLPHSIRKRYSQTGTYWGVRPIKLPNGRLLWPADTVQRITEGR
ncbi:DNA-binding protein [Cupriavidus cauae]|uniref:DNA-binding protein n=1 Tax=Cupriavidus cauae TaxID=2608999 RepID=A0A5M8ALZ9_9BURK|nr:DNA-binding protein [Cupriavidus cauae]KAA6124493.1 DNA-binding protein [Cupriavidus cauae]